MKQTNGQNPGLESLRSYPLLRAMQQRRSRRMAHGLSVEAYELTHRSKHNAAHPLDPLEEAILICSTGLTGVVMHDGPLAKPNGKPEELGSMFINVLARSAPSPDNCQATSLFMINDDGIWLIRCPNGRKALELIESVPASWTDWSDSDWLRVAEAMKVKVHEGRIEFPREFPFYLGWNKQLSNPKGSTIFLPVLDCTRQYINLLLGLLSEPVGQRPLFIDDWQPFRPRSLKDVAAWFGQYLGLNPKIPYQPIGGIDRATDGFVNPEIPIPLGYARMWRIDSEMFFLLQNLMLMGEAIGLGAWGHASPFFTHIFERDEGKGWLGLGFHFEPPSPSRRVTSPPVPASERNPVGIRGLLEGLCPPFVNKMDDAVEKVLDEKFGNDGIFTKPDLLARAYCNKEDAQTYISHLERDKQYTAEAVQYTKDICNYIYDTYGRFPAHVNAFHTPGYWLQFHHIEDDYYERFFEPAQWQNQAVHDKLWHSDGKGSSHHH